MGCRVAYDPVLPYLFSACFKLRFNKANHHRVICQKLGKHGNYQSKRDKRNIYAYKINNIGNLLLCNIPDICSFKINHLVVLTKAPGKLTVTDIYGINPGCAALQHTIGKAARRSSYIHTNFSFKVKAVNFHCFFKFKSAAAYIFKLLSAKFNIIFRCNKFPGFICLLTVDIYFTGHDFRFGTLAALNNSSGNKFNIKTLLFCHSKASFLILL